MRKRDQSKFAESWIVAPLKQVEGRVVRQAMCAATWAFLEGPTTAVRTQLTHGGFAVRKRYEARGCWCGYSTEPRLDSDWDSSSLVGPRGSIIERVNETDRYGA
jgi:hypothetical protein